MGIGTIFSSLLATILALAVVLGLAWATIWMLRRLQDKRMGAGEDAGDGRSLRFVRALPLGPRERLVLVESGGEQLLLGVTGGMISLVARWDAEGRRLAGEDAEPGAKQRYSPMVLAAMREHGGGKRDG